MRLVTWNVNGLRAAIRKGLDDFITKLDPDVLLLQEIRCLPEQLPADWSVPDGYEMIWHPAIRKGYSGVATLSKISMEEIGRGMPSTMDSQDSEGRLLHTRHGNLHCINTYLPSGSAKIERQMFKEEWMVEFREHISQFLDSDLPVIVAGDLNIAHTEQDIWNARSNQNTSGFLPHEREWFSALLGDGWQDLFRIHVGAGQGPYSWWSNRGRARELDRGWRIDYLLANATATAGLKSAEILREGGLVVSDHAPVIVDLNL